MKIFESKFLHAAIFYFLLTMFFIFVFFPALKKVNTDFPNYYVSANMFLDDKDLTEAYDNVQFNKQVLLYGIENQIVSFVPYPPVNSLLMLPFCRLDPLKCKLYWNLLNIVFFMFSIYFISYISGLNYYLTGIIFFVSGYAFVNNFFFGQAYLLVLFCLSAALYFFTRGGKITPALFLALSVLFKFYTIFFLILFLCRKKFRFVFYSIVFILLFNVIAIAITGWDVNYFYYTKVLPRISDGWVGTVFAPEFQSVVSLLHKIFTAEPSLNPDPLYENLPLFYIFKYFFYTGIILTSIYAVFHSKNENSSLKLQIALFCVVCMLLLPVNASYQYVILIPAIAILVKYYVDRKHFYKALVLLVLFFAMNSPLSVYVVNLTKNNTFFIFGYIKLFILMYLFVSIILILMKNQEKQPNTKVNLNYTIALGLLVLILSKMSLALNMQSEDTAKNLFTNTNYLISMPTAFEDKILFTECIKEKFVLNSNFGFGYDAENIFEPEFENQNTIIYETIKNGEKVFKRLNVDNLRNEIIAGFHTRNLQFTKDSTMKCFSENGHVFLQYLSTQKITQLTSGNSFNSRPSFAANDSKIIFCSDRNRGVGFTTIYEIELNNLMP